MLITRTCPFTDKELSLDIPVTQEEYDSWVLGYKTAEHAFQNIPKDLIQFIKDGIPPEEYPDTYDPW